MIRTVTAIAATFLAGGTGAAAQEVIPIGLSTGSPSNAAATVSPDTVAQAMERPFTDGLTASVGLVAASGDFGAAEEVPDTEFLSAAFGLRYVTGNLRLNASIPWMRIRSNGTIFTGIDSTPVVVAASVPGPRAVADGFGDLTLGAAYTLPAAPDSVQVELSGRVKLPTATDESGLSSGETDYSVGVEVSKAVGRLAPFVSASYRVIGDPEGLFLRNGWAASAGASLVAGERTTLLASYHYSRAASRLVRDAHEMFFGGSTPFSARGPRVSAFTTVGLSSGAAAVSGGLSLSVGL